MLAARLLPVVAPVEAVAGYALLLQLHQALDVVLGLAVRPPAAVTAGVRSSGKFPEIQRGDGGRAW